MRQANSISTLKNILLEKQIWWNGSQLCSFLIGKLWSPTVLDVEIALQNKLESLFEEKPDEDNR